MIIYDKCKRCRGNILSHTIYMECCVCKYELHLQCIPPKSRNEYDELRGKSDDWICPFMLDWNSPIQSLWRWYQLLWCSYGYILWHWSLFIAISRNDNHTISINKFWKRFSILIPIRIFFQNNNLDMFQISKYYMENPFNERCQNVFKNE